MTRRKKSRSRFVPLLLGLVIGGGAVWLYLAPPAFVKGLLLRAPRSAPAPAAAAGPAPVPAREAKTSSPAPPSDFEAAAPAPKGGVVALVIDDLGYDAAALRKLEALGGPVGLAVIPSAPHAAEAAALAKRRSWDLLVHLPMSPEAGAHEAEAVGPGDTDAAIVARVEGALAKVPGAIGLNNHQGSRATADPRVVRAVLSIVRDRGLFFLDSRTSPASVAEKEARALGVSTIGRDVFLDDAESAASDPGGEAAALAGAWQRALATAAKQGHCVVIGHPHPGTLSFLAAHLGAAGAPKLVKVSELVD